MADSDDAKEVICEFFGIKIKTKNANLARVLTTDVHEVLNLDIKEIPAFLKGEQAEEKNQSEEAENEDTEDSFPENPLAEKPDSI